MLKSCKLPHVVTVTKRGNHGDLANYSPILFTTIVCQIVERIIDGHLMVNPEENDCLSDPVYGFSRNQFTRDPRDTHMYMEESLVNSDEALEVPLYVSKAFDRVRYKSLITKVSSCYIFPGLIA